MDDYDLRWDPGARAQVTVRPSMLATREEVAEFDASFEVTGEDYRIVQHMKVPNRNPTSNPKSYPKRKTVFMDYQVHYLENKFLKQPRPSQYEMQKIALKLGAPLKRVQEWFFRKRYNDKNRPSESPRIGNPSMIEKIAHNRKMVKNWVKQYEDGSSSRSQPRSPFRLQPPRLQPHSPSGLQSASQRLSPTRFQPYSPSGSQSASQRLSPTRFQPHSPSGSQSASQRLSPTRFQPYSPSASQLASQRRSPPGLPPHSPPRSQWCSSPRSPPGSPTWPHSSNRRNKSDERN